MIKHLESLLVLISFASACVASGYLIGHSHGYKLGHTIFLLDKKFHFKHNGVDE